MEILPPLVEKTKSQSNNQSLKNLQVSTKQFSFIKKTENYNISM